MSRHSSPRDDASTDLEPKREVLLAFKATARHQSRLVAASERDADDQAFVDAISEF